jgi:hypothetical protein
VQCGRCRSPGITHSLASPGPPGVPHPPVSRPGGDGLESCRITTDGAGAGRARWCSAPYVSLARQIFSSERAGRTFGSTGEGCSPGGGRSPNAGSHRTGPSPPDPRTRIWGFWAMCSRAAVGWLMPSDRLFRAYLGTVRQYLLGGAFFSATKPAAWQLRSPVEGVHRRKAIQEQCSWAA